MITEDLAPTGVTVVRGENGITVFRDQGLEVAANVRQPVTACVAEHPGLRLLEPRFMEIRQALGITKSRSPETVAFLAAVVEELKANGFVAEALRRAGQAEDLVAPA